MKNITALTLGVLLLTTGLSFAQQSSVATQAAQPVQIGNKICPVSGGPVKGSMGDTPVTVEYNGKVYNLCCPGCLSLFKKNPEYYSNIAEKEVASKK